MKLLENRLVVAGLAVASLAVVAYQLWPALGPNRGRGPAASSPASRTQASSRLATAPHPTVAGATTNLQRPLRPLDTDYLRSHFDVWRESPRRDPFERFPKPKGAESVSAVELLALSATWRQSGARMAVINGSVVGEQDTIRGFRVENINGDFVWVTGPEGRRERIDFGTKPLTNSSKLPANLARNPK